MARHRILIVGARGSGRAWLAGRIHALTGIPIATGAGVPGREWMRLAERAEQVADSAGEADLIVLVRTPAWLRDLRLFMRRATPPRTGGKGLRASLRATHRWDVDELPRLAALLEGRPVKVMTCASSEDVRAVLECVFGLDEVDAPVMRAKP